MRTKCRNMIYPELIGEMAKNNETQDTLSELLGLTRATIINKMAGRSEWNISEVDKICEHYNKNYYELFKRNEK